MRLVILALAACLAAVATDAAARDPMCQHCGCHERCQKRCRLVCETKKVQSVEYSCECEDFCVPGKSRRMVSKSQCDCDARGHACRHVQWQPTTAKVRTRRKLVKHVVTKEVPSYRWVVEDVCGQCGACADGGKCPSGELAADGAQWNQPTAGAYGEEASEGGRFDGQLEAAVTATGFYSPAAPGGLFVAPQPPMCFSEE